MDFEGTLGTSNEDFQDFSPDDSHKHLISRILKSPDRCRIILFTTLIIAFTILNSYNLLRFLRFLPLGKPQSKAKRLSNPKLCRALIACDLVHGSNVNRLSPLESRALANERLQSAFGIHNAFTTTDKRLAQDFVRDMKDRMSCTPFEHLKLGHLSGLTRQWIERGFSGDDGSWESPKGHASREESPDGFVVNVTSLVQVLVFQALFLCICDGSEVNHGLPPSKLAELARCINRTWINSKEEHIVKFEDNQELQALLREAFPCHGQGTYNMLNILIPSFETMWRVVLRGFLQVRFSVSAGHEWCSVLAGFAESRTKKQFEWHPEWEVLSTDEGTNPLPSDTTWASSSAEEIVKEVLRLYPPTRRIFRAYQWVEDSRYSNVNNWGTKKPLLNIEQRAGNYNGDAQITEEIIAADIEACHLDPEIWGIDAETFDPLRWREMTDKKSEAFMPFGGRPFECPARNVFGPQMIGFLMGTLITAVDDNHSEAKMTWKLDCANEDLIRRLLLNARLDMGRDTYDDLELIGSWE